MGNAAMVMLCITTSRSRPLWVVCLLLLGTGCVGCATVVPEQQRLSTSSSTIEGCDRSSRVTTSPSNGIVESMLQGIFVGSLAQVAPYLPRIAEAAATASEYRSARGRWPTSKDDLTQFAKDRGVELDLSEFFDLRILPTGKGDRARMAFVIHPKAAQGEIKGEAEIPQ